jgi:hypothetical protein
MVPEINYGLIIIEINRWTDVTKLIDSLLAGSP